MSFCIFLYAQNARNLKNDNKYLFVLLAKFSSFLYLYSEYAENHARAKMYPMEILQETMNESMDYATIYREAEK